MTIADRVNILNKNIGDVTILAASKSQSNESIEEAYAAGITNFGENYLQEALNKIAHLKHLPICWHFIGAIQSKKAKSVAQNFSWVHSLDREKIALKLNDARDDINNPINICIQINFDEESAKSGVNPKEAEPLASYILQLQNLKLRGLMMIPKAIDNEDYQYESFLRLTKLRDSLNQRLNITMDTLSMGMSHDYLAAIRAGSTIIRIGTGIFGQRVR